MQGYSLEGVGKLSEGCRHARWKNKNIFDFTLI